MVPKPKPKKKKEKTTMSLQDLKSLCPATQSGATRTTDPRVEERLQPLMQMMQGHLDEVSAEFSRLIEEFNEAPDEGGRNVIATVVRKARAYPVKEYIALRDTLIGWHKSVS